MAMTETPRSQRAISALAAFVHEARSELDLPTWDEPGIAAEARRHPLVPLSELGITLLRACSLPANETPACISQPDNRAWFDNHPYRCRKHPEVRARRTNGQCAGCWADANEAPPPEPTSPGERAHPLREAIERVAG